MARNEVRIYNSTLSADTGVTLSPCRRLKPSLSTERFARDINGVLYVKDLSYDTVEELEIEFYLTSLSHTELNTLWNWNENKTRLNVQDMAFTSPQDLAADAYYKTYSGYIIEMPNDFMSPAKMTGDPVTVRMMIDSVTMVAI